MLSLVAFHQVLNIDSIGILILKVHFDELSHLAFRQEPVLVLVKFFEKLVKVLLLVVLSPIFVDYLHDFIQEYFGLIFVKVPVLIRISLVPNFINGLAELRLVVFEVP